MKINFLILSYKLFISIFAISIQITNSQQSYCWEPCTFNCPKSGPKLCPPESILTYFDCCPGQGCCQYIKWPNLIFLIFIIFMFLIGCCCCFFFLFADARMRMFAKQNLEQQKHNNEAGYVNAANSLINEESLINSINAKSIAYLKNENDLTNNVLKTPMIYHKRSTVV